MKLRNKRTGDIWEFDLISMKIADTTLEKLKAKGFSGSCCARSLAELNEEWEDYKPAEPLIKDEKVRKAVKAWAEAWNKNKLYKDADNVLSTVDNFVIQFGQTAFIDLEEKKPYTIAELCGEEEE
jgi:hypothetical protein